MTIENRAKVKANQCKGLLDDYEFERFKKVMAMLGIEQVGTATRVLIMLAVDVAEMHTPEGATSIEDLNHIYKQNLMELDVRRFNDRCEQFRQAN